MIHALVEADGRGKVKPTPYRDGQNVIKDSKSGAIVYMPPEAKDVPELMKELVEWLTKCKNELPFPLLGAIAHYQFVTIHPYYDGNGRTARLFTTLVLYQGGYDLKGLYSLEEYYARDLQGYYEAIGRGQNHNYYFGRAEADITPWIEYFILGMLDAFLHVKTRAEEAKGGGATDKSELLRHLSPKQRKVLTLFTEQAIIAAKDVEKLFGFGSRASRLLCSTLVEEGFLIIADKANKTRTYKLAEQYERLIS
jgi:Fic family protein